jgi:transposase
MILGAEITPADMHDTKSLEDSLHKAQIHLEEAGSDMEIRDVAADKGYHSTEALSELSGHTNYRSDIPVPKSPEGRNWSKTTLKERKAVLANRRRTKGIRAANLKGCEASKWNDRSRMCWRQAEDDDVDFVEPRRSRNGTF